MSFQNNRLLNVLAVFVKFYLCAIALLTLSRILLFGWQFERIDSLETVLYVLLQGVRFDIVTASFLAIVPATLSVLFSFNQSATRLMIIFNRYYLAVIFGLLVFLEVATPNFVTQFGLRPNVWFVEYLKYPNEVLSMLMHGFLLSTIVGLILSTTGALLFLHYSKLTNNGKLVVTDATNTSFLKASLLAVTVFLLMAMSIRSSLGHRPLSPSHVAFSQDQFLNTLPLNSFYSAGYAAYQLISESAESTVYMSVKLPTLVEETRKFMAINSAQFVSEEKFTLHSSDATIPASKNLVIILQESLGAEFVEQLGGMAVTPNLQALGEEGWWFEQMYATGTRSARGIEAVVTGFLPTSAQSIIKRSKSQSEFFTIASLLKSQGYATDFIYGGDSSFDNMRAFFLANGFDTVFDQHDFINPIYNGSWGVSDEDLFNKAHQDFLQRAPNGPFFSLVFTSSNHAPFEYPAGRVEPYENVVNSAPSAVRYADFALAEFIKKAKNSDYWQDTVFLIVADHASRVFGDELVPINRFHIPALVIGGSIQPKKVNRVVSQIDLMPTMLSLIGISSTHPMIGLDLTRTDLAQIPQKNIMQYADVQAYREDQRVIIFQPKIPAKQFDIIDGKLVETSQIDAALLSRAASLSELPTHLYENKLY